MTRNSCFTAIEIGWRTMNSCNFDTYLRLGGPDPHGAVIVEIRSEVTDAAGKPVVTSVVTMLGEAAYQDAGAEETVAAVASISAGK